MQPAETMPSSTKTRFGSLDGSPLERTRASLDSAQPFVATPRHSGRDADARLMQPVAELTTARMTDGRYRPPHVGGPDRCRGRVVVGGLALHRGLRAGGDRSLGR